MVHTYIHTYMYIHTHTYTYIHIHTTYIHTYIHTYTYLAARMPHDGQHPRSSAALTAVGCIWQFSTLSRGAASVQDPLSYPRTTNEIREENLIISSTKVLSKRSKEKRGGEFDLCPSMHGRFLPFCTSFFLFFSFFFFPNSAGNLCNFIVLYTPISWRFKKQQYDTRQTQP